MSAAGPKGTAEPDRQNTIARLRAIASQSTEALLMEGPVHQDHRLLEICAEGLHFLNEVRACEKQLEYRWMQGGTEAEKERNRQWSQAHVTCTRAASMLMRAATKLRATTPAGIYAKALLVRQSKCGAAKLGASLAAELVDNPVLRASLWPAGEGMSS